jgi:hypothetical protein
MSDLPSGPRLHDHLGRLVRDRIPEAAAGPPPPWLRGGRDGRARRRRPSPLLLGGALAMTAGLAAIALWPRGPRPVPGRSGPLGSVVPPAPRASSVVPPAANLNECLHAEIGATGVDVAARSSDEPWVSMGPDQRLRYRESERGDRVLDFSHAGYHGGEKEPPRVPAFAPAVAPGGEQDDSPAIQAAIDALAARAPDAGGFRGAVELGPGTFTLLRPLRITQDGIVLRGAGARGQQRTVLRASGKFHPALIAGLEGRRVRFKTAYPVAEAYVPVGARTLTLTDVGDLKVGQDVVVERPATRRWECALGMDGLEQREGAVALKSWQIGTELRIDRRITAIDGHRVTLDVPLPTALERAYTVASVRRARLPDRIAEVGIEELSFQADFDDEQQPGLENALVDVAAVDDGWIRNVTLGGAVPIGVRLGRFARRLTVSDTVVSSELNRSVAFHLSGQQLLVTRSRAEGPGLRAIMTTAATPGPNAVVDFDAVGANQEVETQRRWAVGLLLDNVRVTDTAGNLAGVISIANQGSRGSGHGWSGANSMVWNSRARWIVVDSPPTAANRVTGGEAGSLFGTGSFSGVGTRAVPDSLYRAQRAERLGR